MANSLFTSWQYAFKSENIDFFTWWVVPHTVVKHKIDNIYSEEGREELARLAKEEVKSNKISFRQKQTQRTVLRLYNDQIITTATPFFYSAFNRLVSRQYPKDRLKFIVMSIGCSAASLFILGHLLGYSMTGILLMSAFFLSIYSPSVVDFRVGNCNHIQLFLLSLFGWLFSRGKNLYYLLAAGFILGLSVMLKPNMIFIAVFSVLFVVLKKQFYKLWAFVLGILLGVFISFYEGVMFFQNPRIWNDWFATLSATISYSFTLAKGNYSLSKMIFDANGFKTSAIIYFILTLIFIMIILVRNKAETSSQKTSLLKINQDGISDLFIIIGFGSTSLLLASGLVWTHYYVLNIPLIYYLLRPQVESVNVISRELMVKGILGLMLMLQSRGFIGFMNTEMTIAVTYNFVAAGIFGLLLYDSWRSSKYPLNN